MAIELNRLTAAQLRALPAAQTVFFLPVGPLEDHGPHLPLSADLVEAQGLCRMAAERLEKEKPGWVGVIMPSVPLGVDSNTTDLALTVRPHILRDWLVDACRSLARHGFRQFVCFSGHLGPKQLTAIEEAGKIVSRRWLGPRRVLISACSAVVPAREIFRSPLWPDPLEHGARRDTSVLLALAPEQVEASSGSLAAQPREGSPGGRLFRRWRGQVSGYWGGRPAEGSPAEGQRVLQGTLDEIFPKMRAVWEGANPNHLFRSWYSVIPPNQSFFRAWLLAVMILVMLGLWSYLNTGLLPN